MDEFSTTDFEDTEPGGSTFVPASTYTDTMSQSDFDAFNNPAGNTSNNYVQPGAYAVDANGNKITDWSKALGQAKNFINENKGLITAAGALFAANSSPTVDKKTGYQGGIPLLQASRSMYTRPPTKAQGYRPGAGGIDYGGDVTYTRMAPGSDPWAGLSGTSGSTGGANLTTLPADVATAVSNAITGGTSGGTNVTNTGATGLTQAQKDAIAVDNWRKSLTPQQYLSAINQWIASNPNMTKADLDAAMTKFKVSQTDLQTALGQNKTLSAADIYALTHGMGLKEANAQQTAGIVDWINKNPYATSTQIKDAIKASGVNTTDITEALAGTKLSGAAQKALTEGTGLDQLYKTILDYQASGATPEQVAAAKAQYKVSDADMAAAAKYATDTGYKAVDARQAAAAAAAEWERQNAARWEAENAARWEAENAARWEAQHAAEVAAAQEAAQRAANENKQTPSNNQSTALDTTNEIYQYFASPATQAALASGDIRSIADTMDALGYSPAEVAAATGTPLADVQAAYNSVRDNSYMQYAAGGEINMAKGRYLQGETDGMADELPAKIGTDEPAALSHGEFVIPADVVSHLGNGNSDAGAKKLYQMMDKIRMARTGTKKQGKRINPDKFMPGGLAQAYAKGGKIKKYAGETDSFVTGNRAYSSGIQGIESNLSNWAGPYVTNMLGQGQALANMPYAAYMGPLTAGESPLQTGAFKTAAGLTTPTSIGTAASTAGDIATTAKGLTYTPSTTTFDETQMKNYMNPFLKGALEPQLEEARRQSQITQQQNAAKMTQAGAFGGGRQAILDAETQRNLGTTLANITGQGYSTAYDKAMAQFNADQARKAQEAQFGATYGLQGLQTGLQGAQTQGALGTQEQQAGLNNLNAMLAAGAQQRGIEAEGIAADKAQFEEARANPYKMVQFQQSLLQGLPLAAQSYQGIEPNALLKASQGATTVNQLLKNLGLIS